MSVTAASSMADVTAGVTVDVRVTDPYRLRAVDTCAGTTD
jgi:hypothetical protein